MVRPLLLQSLAAIVTSDMLFIMPEFLNHFQAFVAQSVFLSLEAVARKLVGDRVLVSSACAPPNSTAARSLGVVPRSRRDVFENFIAP